MQATCHGCGEAFEARRSSAKWCSDRCRKQAARRAAAAEPPADDQAETDQGPEHADTGLVLALRRKLEAAHALDTIAGQQALVLARSMTKVDASGISGLSKELSRVTAEALGTSAAPGDDGAAEPSDPDDELRKKRDAKRQAAREASS